MEPGKKELDRLFRRFMEGDCTPEETELLWQWFWLLDLRSQDLLRSRQQEDVIREEMRSTIMAKINPRKPARIRGWQLAAAAMLAGLIVSLALFIPGIGPDKKHLAENVIVNDTAAVISFYLPDSSRVILSRSSRLTWKEDFDAMERRVTLSGEGYFDVHPNQSHPFIVESNGIETRALGTAFTIEAYEGETETRVLLLQGKVEVAGRQKIFQPALLEPGQLLRYRRHQKDIQVEKITVSDPLAWTRGGMTFNNLPLSEALDRLARRYSIIIRYDPGRLKGKMVSGSFHNASWEKLLQGILFVHGLRYRVAGGFIQIAE